MRPIWLSLLLAYTCEAAPPPGSEVDLAQFGRLKGWHGAEEHDAVKASAPWRATPDACNSSNFGVSFRVEPQPDRQYADAVVELPAGFRAKEIALRVRDPDGRLPARVEVDGRAWSRFDGPRELIFLGPESGVRIRVYF